MHRHKIKVKTSGAMRLTCERLAGRRPDSLAWAELVAAPLYISTSPFIALDQESTDARLVSVVTTGFILSVFNISGLTDE
jgi:hypothetical protein